MSHKSVVYFIAGEGRIKIGTTTNLQERIYCLSCLNGAKLTLIGCIGGSFKTERSVHAVLSAFRLSPAGEWFRDCEELRRGIADVIKAGAPPDLTPIPLNRPRTEAEDIAMFQRLFAVLWPGDAIAGLAEITELSPEECRPWALGEELPPRLVRCAIACHLVSESDEKPSHQPRRPRGKAMSYRVVE